MWGKCGGGKCGPPGPYDGYDGSWGGSSKGDRRTPKSDPWSKSGKGAKAADQSLDYENEKEQLAQCIKDIQRASQAGRDVWEKYCAALRTGNNDPSKHTAESLRNFLDAYECGEDPEARARVASRSTKVLRLRGVPFQSKLADVVSFLEEYRVPESQVCLSYSSDGKRTGEAYAVFSSARHAEHALDSLQRKEIRGRYIELFRSHQEEWDNAASLGKGTGGGSSGYLEKEELVARVKWVQRSDPQGKEQWYAYCDATRTGNRDPSRHSVESMSLFLEAYERGEPPELPAERAAGDCRVLRLRGVPFQSSISDVVDFLKEYGVDKSMVALAYTSDGRRTGEAYATFAAAKIADRALNEKQRHEIGGRYIELFRASEEEMQENTQMQTQVEDAPQSEANEKEALVARVKGIQRSSKDGRECWESYCDKLRTGIRDPVRHTAESIRNFLSAYERGETPGEPTAGEGKDCQVIRLRGVPFQSEVDDIVHFLRDYGIDQTKVVLGFGADGRKTGQAFVAFASAELAERAMEEKQFEEIRGRYIELFRSNLEEWNQAADGGQGTSSAAIAPSAQPAMEDDEEEEGEQEMPDDAGSRQFEPVAPWRYTGESEMDKLVSQVKLIQRSSHSGKECWERYCDALRTGKRDPQRHTEESIRNFLAAYERGDSPEVPASWVGGDGRVLRLRGVPFQSDVMDIVKFLEDYFVEPSMVALACSTDGKATGEAFATFSSRALAERALDEMQRKEIRGRYIELFRSSYEERDQNTAVVKEGWEEKESLVARVKGIQRSDARGKEMWYNYCDELRTGNRDPSRHSVDSIKHFLTAYDRGEQPRATSKVVGDGRVLRLRGVPFQCGVQDIVQFLSGYRVDAQQIALGKSAEGRPTGDAYVMFPHADAAEEAMEERQNQEIRGRYIEVFRSTYDDWTQAHETQDREVWPQSGGPGRYADADYSTEDTGISEWGGWKGYGKGGPYDLGKGKEWGYDGWCPGTCGPWGKSDAGKNGFGKGWGCWDDFLKGGSCGPGSWGGKCGPMGMKGWGFDWGEGFYGPWSAKGAAMLAALYAYEGKGCFPFEWFGGKGGGDAYAGFKGKKGWGVGPEKRSRGQDAVTADGLHDSWVDSSGNGNDRDKYDWDRASGW